MSKRRAPKYPMFAFRTTSAQDQRIRKLPRKVRRQVGYCLRHSLESTLEVLERSVRLAA